MEAIEDRLKKLREERIAREKARIEKLRELNLKKYNKNESLPNNSVSNPVNNSHMHGATRRPSTAPVTSKYLNIKPKTPTNTIPNKVHNKENLKPINITKKLDTNLNKTDKTVSNIPKGDKDDKKQNGNLKNPKIPVKNYIKMNCKRLSTIPKTGISNQKPAENLKKNIQPANKPSNPKLNTESVFDRLYKPKPQPKKEVNDVQRLKTDPNYLKKVLNNSNLILNSRRTMYEVKKTTTAPVRRSISAVHFKRISKNEINNCIHKWSSVGEKINKLQMNEVNEDESVKEEKVVSAVKSERKKVKFQTPATFNFNTPKPEEMQAKLKNWLQKSGKSFDSYHHLQCFGIHLEQNKIKPLNINEPEKEFYDDENKENIALESDSDNNSYTENVDDRKFDFSDGKDVSNKWRRASYVSDSVDFNETHETTVNSEEIQHVDDLLLGALNDLTELLREGFDWEQCARWLRAIRERFPSAPETAAYWECRAALEERRVDFPASVLCWEEAIAKGTERSVVEANLDQLLDKFMQLKISPNSGKKKQVDPKMVDVKNVFKSTIIRFAVQQAKLRQSNQQEPAKYTVTPVRRSARLSSHWSGRTPLQLCTSMKQAGQICEKLVFVPNDKLCDTP